MATPHYSVGDTRRIARLPEKRAELEDILASGQYTCPFCNDPSRATKDVVTGITNTCCCKTCFDTKGKCHGDRCKARHEFPTSPEAAPISGGPATAKQKIILVSDFGGDVDDAHALHMLLHFWKDRADLLGIVTTCGMRELRPKLVQWFLQKARCDVPVLAGRARPLGTCGNHAGTPAAPFKIEGEGMLKDAPALRDRGFDPDYGTDENEFQQRWGHCQAHNPGSMHGALAQWVEEELQMQPTSSPSSDAADFIAQMAKRHPGAVKVVAIGSMTDVAIALHCYSGLASMLQGVVFMGMCNTTSQCYRGPRNGQGKMGMNMKQDMIAAAVVAESGVQLTCVTSELTRTYMDFGTPPNRPEPFPVLNRLRRADDKTSAERGEVTAMLATLTQIWWDYIGWLGLADPLTVAVALDPEKCGKYRHGRFQVDLQLLGVNFEPDNLGSHWVLDADTFHAEGYDARFVEEFARAFDEYWHV